MISFSWTGLANLLRMALRGKVDTKVRSVPFLTSVHVDPNDTLLHAPCGSQSTQLLTVVC